MRLYEKISVERLCASILGTVVCPMRCNHGVLVEEW